MLFDRLLKVVNVDELDVKLILVMFYLSEVVFGESVIGELLEARFALVKFFPIISQGFSPASALAGELCDVCLNHGFKF